MRREDWLMRLHDAIDAAQGRGFVWGTHDCCTFAADCAEAMTGERPWLTGLSGYSTQAGARKALAKAGHTSLEGALTAVFGEAIPAGLAQRGDIVLLADVTCAVVDTTGEALVGPSPDGLVRRPVSDGLMAWRVG